MRLPESCAKCLYDRQCARTDDPAYLEEVRRIIEERGDGDASPVLLWRFNQVYQRYFGATPSYADVKRKYNDLVLSMEEQFRAEIESAADPLATALSYARVGNYIDFGAMKQVEEAEFLSLFHRAEMSPGDRATYESFRGRLQTARSFLLIADNCGEIVLDRLFVEQVRKMYPALRVSVMVRGGEVLNDVTAEDAEYVGMDRVAEILSTGLPLGGVVYEKLPETSRQAFDAADLILAKGQGNYETLSGRGFHIYYSFLCKCELFITKFAVPKLTGLFVEE